MTGPVPPASDPQAERACLAAALLDPDARATVATLVSEADWYGDQHRWIWRAVAALDSEARSVDLVTVASWLRREGRLAQAGGSPYLAELIDQVPAVANVAEYARIVADLGRLRRVVALCQRVVAEAPKVSDVSSYLMGVEGDVTRLTSGARPDTESGVLCDVVDAATTQSSAVQKGQRVASWRTGIRELDDLFDGFSPGQVYVVAGVTGMGKSVVAATLAETTCIENEGLAAVYFSLEMRRLELGQRSVARLASVPLTSIRRGAMDRAEWMRAIAAKERVAEIPLYIDDTSRLTPYQIRSLARRHTATLRERFGADLRLGLVVVDYVQLLAADNRGANRVAEYEEISRELKLLSRELDCALVAVAQVNREIHGRDKQNRRPKVSDLRGCGAWENDADKILFVHRNDYYEPDPKEHDGEAEIILAKGRDTGTGTQRVAWEGRFMRIATRETFRAQRELYDGDDDDNNNEENIT